MKTNSRFLLTASMALALVFTTSCSSGDDGEGSSPSTGGGNSSSSGGGGSSSSIYVYIQIEVDACGDVVTDSDANTMTCNGQTYKTVVIGSQTWMAENLNYEVESSRCLVDNPLNCVKYGRLYDGYVAMMVCPDGWHLPSAADWNILMDYVQTDNGSTYTSGETASIAGKYLKATSGWLNENGEFKGNGEDKYGFTALSGGTMYIINGNVLHNLNGYHGAWWSSSESVSNGAYSIGMHGNYEAAFWSEASKSGNLFSVRCVKD